MELFAEEKELALWAKFFSSKLFFSTRNIIHFPHKLPSFIKSLFCD